MPTVGIIANPAAGKDIRRLVAQGRVVSNQEKSNTLRRVFAGLQSHGVTKVIVMPDMGRIGARRDGGYPRWDAFGVHYTDSIRKPERFDTRRPASCADAGADCIVTLGGDGTNRLVAKGCGDVPMAPISTGTNNVFPKEIEGTLAGIAAATVAADQSVRDRVCRRSKKINIFVNGELRDIALVDAAVSRQTMVGARALWDVGTLDSVFLTRAEASSIGIASIGARLALIGLDEPRGLHIEFPPPGSSGTSTSDRTHRARNGAANVPIEGWRVIVPGETINIRATRGTIALDGEREVELLDGMSASVCIRHQRPLGCGLRPCP